MVDNYVNPVTKLTYEELMDECARQAHDGLLSGGGKELKSKMWIIYHMMTQWYNVNVLVNGDPSPLDQLAKDRRAVIIKRNKTKKKA